MHKRYWIFDIDGTLLDSNNAHAQALQSALKEAGHPFSFDEIRKRIGMGIDQILPRLIHQSAESEIGKRISRLKGEAFDQIFPKLQPFPAATELLRTLQEKNCKITVATSASKSDLEKFIQKLEIGPYLTAPVSSDDAEKSKPDKDIVVEALRVLRCRPGEAYLVGDTPYDIEAAKKAGVETIALRSGGWKDEDLEDAKFIFSDAQELLLNLERLS